MRRSVQFFATLRADRPVVESRVPMAVGYTKSYLPAYGFKASSLLASDPEEAISDIHRPSNVQFRESENE